mmetsp:Transcript_5657/g.21411  ORF Transcript_5657/g.21411 Transcript_5657/m.21411 type:complete len:700 (-) Transcript_5657:425-2524(-)
MQPGVEEPSLDAPTADVQRVIREELRLFGEEFRACLRADFEGALLLGPRGVAAVAAASPPDTCGGAAAAPSANTSRLRWSAAAEPASAVQKQRRSEPVPGALPCPGAFVPLRGYSTSRYAKMLAEGECDPDEVSEVLPIAFRAREHSTRTSMESRRSAASRASRSSASSTSTSMEPLPEQGSSPTASEVPAAAAERGVDVVTPIGQPTLMAAGGDGKEHPFGLYKSEDASQQAEEETSSRQGAKGDSAVGGAKVGCSVSARPSVMKEASSMVDAVTLARARKVRHNRSVVERALALTPARTLRFGQLERGRAWLAADRLLRSARLEVVTMAMICLSAALVGVQTLYMTRDMQLEVPVVLHVFDVLLCIFFCFELGLRVFVHRSAFFRVWGWGWNLFDTLLVGSQVLEETLRVFAGSNKFRAGLSGFSPGFLLRAARLLRAVRVVRVLHVMRFTEELRMLVGCVVYSLRSFFWASVLLSLIIYVASLSLTQMVLVYFIENQQGDDTGSLELMRLYGTLPQSLLSIFLGLTGGLDWHELVDPLIVHISPALGVLFCLYMAFALLAVLNVVTATFVEGVTKRAAHVKEIQKMRDASRLFRHLDLDNSGYISFEEIADHLESPEVQSFFQSIDVDTGQARSLFNLLDADGSGIIEFQEFLSGCVRLQGPAKASDLVLAMRELRASLGRSSMSVGSAMHRSSSC